MVLKRYLNALLTVVLLRSRRTLMQKYLSFVARFLAAFLLLFFLQLWTCAQLTARTSFTASLARDFTTANAKPDSQALIVTSMLTNAVQVLVSMASV